MNVAGIEPKLWSWAAGLFGDVPGVAYFKAVHLEESFGSVDVTFTNGYSAWARVNSGQLPAGRYELRVVAPDGEPERPVGLDDDAVIDALRTVSGRRARFENDNPSSEA